MKVFFCFLNMLESAKKDSRIRDEDPLSESFFNSWALWTKIGFLIFLRICPTPVLYYLTCSLFILLTFWVFLISFLMQSLNSQFWSIFLDVGLVLTMNMYKDCNLISLGDKPLLGDSYVGILLRHTTCMACQASKVL